MCVFMCSQCQGLREGEDSDLFLKVQRSEGIPP